MTVTVGKVESGSSGRTWCENLPELERKVTDVQAAQLLQCSPVWVPWISKSKCSTKGKHRKTRNYATLGNAPASETYNSCSSNKDSEQHGSVVTVRFVSFNLGFPSINTREHVGEQGSITRALGNIRF